MSFFEKQIESATIYDGKILKLQVDKVQLCDGTFSKREVVRHSGGAAVLFIKDFSVLLVKQFRYAYNKEIYEIPAGKLNLGEDPAAAAARELEEETGYKADMKHLIDIYPTPGYTDEVIHTYLAENATYTRPKLDKGEFLSSEFIPLDEVKKMIFSGEINDAKTVSAVLCYLNGK